MWDGFGYISIPLPPWIPLPHWVVNPLYGTLAVDSDLGVYSDAEDPSDAEPMWLTFQFVLFYGNFHNTFPGTLLTVSSMTMRNISRVTHVVTFVWYYSKFPLSNIMFAKIALIMNSSNLMIALFYALCILCVCISLYLRTREKPMVNITGWFY